MSNLPQVTKQNLPHNVALSTSSRNWESIFSDCMGFMVFNTIFNNISIISWLSVLLVEETRLLGGNHRPAAIHCKLYHIMLYRWLHGWIQLPYDLIHIFVFVPNHDLDFQGHMSCTFFMFNDLRWEVVVCFTEIGGIVDNHVLYFLFTITNNNDSSDNEAHKMSVVSVHNLLTLHMVDPCPWTRAQCAATENNAPGNCPEYGFSAFAS